MSCWLTHPPDTPYNYCTCTCVITASEIASHKRKLVVLSIHNKLKICKLAKKGRTLQSISNRIRSVNLPFTILWRTKRELWIKDRNIFMITLSNCDLKSVQLYNNVCYMFVMYWGNHHFNYLNISIIWTPFGPNVFG